MFQNFELVTPVHRLGIRLARFHGDPLDQTIEALAYFLHVGILCQSTLQVDQVGSRVQPLLRQNFRCPGALIVDPVHRDTEEVADCIDPVFPG
jgi:hypothetical protein